LLKISVVSLTHSIIALSYSLRISVHTVNVTMMDNRSSSSAASGSSGMSSQDVGRDVQDGAEKEPQVVGRVDESAELDERISRP